MGSFKKIQKNKDIDARYVRRVIVYLESDEDYQIFKERWFYDQGEFLEFQSADSGLGGGCGQVMNPCK